MHLKKLVFLVALLSLSACLSRSDSSSQIVFEDQARAQEIYSYAQEQLLEYVPEIGGQCVLRETHISCRFPERDTAASTDIFAGFRPNGSAVVTVHTATTHGWGPTEKGAREGRYITDFHKELEQWAIETFKQFQPQERVRRYTNLGEIGTF